MYYRSNLNLQRNQADNCCAERKWRREVGAEVEQRKTISHTGGTHHTHHLGIKTTH